MATSKRTTRLPRHRSGRYVAELVRAIAVVALVFLNFGHTSVLAAQPDLGIQSLCGDALTLGAIAHASEDHLSGGVEHGQSHDVPCHACRIGGAADLPPLPAEIDMVLVASGDVIYAPTPIVRDAAVPQRVGSPRGPPVLA